MQSVSHKRNRWLSGLLSGFCVLLILHTCVNIIEGRRLNRVIRAQAAAGLPMSLRAILPAPSADHLASAAFLDQAFSIMATSNAAPLIATFSNIRFDKADVRTDPSFILFSSLTLQDRNRLEAAFRHPDIVFIHQLLTRSAEGAPAQFPVHYELGLKALTPHLAPLQQAHHALCVRAWLASESKNITQALKDIHTALQLTRGLSNEPLLVAHLTRTTADRKALYVLRNIVRKHHHDSFNTPQLWALLGTLTKTGKNGFSGFVKALDGERIIFGSWLFVSLLTADNKQPLPKLLTESFVMRCYQTVICKPLLKADARMYMTRMKAFRDAAVQGSIRTLQQLTESPPARIYYLTRMIEQTISVGWQSTSEWQNDIESANLMLISLIQARMDAR